MVAAASGCALGCPEADVGVDGGVLHAMQPNSISRLAIGVASARVSVAVPITLLIVESVGVGCAGRDAVGSSGFAAATKEITEVLTAVREVARVLDHSLSDHHRSVFG